MLRSAKARSPLFVLFHGLTASALAQLPEFADPVDLSNAVRGCEIVVPIDMDLDGDLDVAACSPGGGLVIWFENEGGGSIRRRHLITDELRTPIGIEGADFDSDGDVDLLVTTRFQNQVWYLEGNGPDAFLAPVALGGTSYIGQRIELSDLDGDGDLDAIASNRQPGPWGPGPRLVENLGSAMAPARSIADLYEARLHVVPADLDGDGLPDVISSGSGYLWWSRNLGGFDFDGPRVVFNTFSAPSEIALADLDGDGDEDIVVAINGHPEIRFFENLSTPGTVMFGPQLTFLTGLDGENDLAVVDMDLDGDLDVAFARSISSELAWLENQGGLTFVLRGAIANERSQARSSLTATDLDGDGQLDLLMSSALGEVDWIRGDASLSTGVAFEAQVRPIAARLGREVDVAWLDADSDGDLDAIAASINFGLRLATRRGTEGFDTSVTVGLLDQGVLSVESGDLDGDGDDDVLFSDHAGRVGWLAQTPLGFGSVQVLGQFSSGSSIDLELAPQLVDLDSDGDLDVVASLGFSMGSTANSELYTYEQVAPGLFAQRRTLAAILRPFTSFSLGDINGDGLLDALVTTRLGMGDQLRWLPGLGNGQFAPVEMILSPSAGYVNPVLLDTDLDGRVEIYWTEERSTSLRRVEWVSGMQFTTPAVARDIGSFGRGLLANDVNLDGRVDLVFAHAPTAGSQGRIFEWSQRTGTGIFAGAFPIGTASAANTAMELVDFDLDGDADLVVAVGTQGRVSLFENLEREQFGVQFCDPTAPNSVGLVAEMSALGTTATVLNELRLVATELPPGASTLFLGSLTGGTSVQPGGSLGTLCLGGAIGRFQGPGQVQMANQDGAAYLPVDLSAIPQPNGSVPAVSGQLWRFQAWYRDTASGTPTSNFTGGLAIVFS